MPEDKKIHPTHFTVPEMPWKQEKLQIEIPERIYLQIFDEDGEEAEEITWCIDRIYDTDIEYIRKK